MSARDLPPAILAAIWQHLQPGLRASLRDAVAKGLEALKTPEPLNLNEWAERHFYLSAESSQTEQRWVSYPPQRAILAMMGDDDIEEVDVRKSARVGFTKMLLASLAFDASTSADRNACGSPPTTTATNSASPSLTPCCATFASCAPSCPSSWPRARATP